MFETSSRAASLDIAGRMRADGGGGGGGAASGGVMHHPHYPQHPHLHQGQGPGGAGAGPGGVRQQVFVTVAFDFDYLGEDGKKVFMREGELLLLISKTNKDWWQVRSWELCRALKTVLYTSVLHGNGHRKERIAQPEFRLG